MNSSSPLITTVASSGEQAGSDSVLLTVSGALALIILVMVSLAWLARRSGVTRRFNDSRNVISVVASQSLGSRERIVLIDVQDQRLVLGVTATQISHLATLEKSIEEGMTTPVAAGIDFKSVLQKLRQRPGNST